MAEPKDPNFDWPTVELPTVRNSMAMTVVTPYPLPTRGERIMRRRRFFVQSLEVRQFGRRHQQIIGERGGDRLTGRVIAHPFIQRVADAVGDAAVDLPLDEQRIDAAA